MASQFDAEPADICDLFEGRKTLYKIPEYQRPYSWEKRHIDQLWDDLFEAWNAEKNGDDSYFLGTVILVDNGEKRLDILDGQQRITTLIIFYAVLRDFFSEELASQMGTIERRLEDSSGDDSTYRLRTGEKHQDEFETTILSGVDLSEDNNYTDAAKYTKNALEDKFEDPEELRNFYDFVELEVEIIQIETSDLSYAIRLFQTANTRGKDLTVSDLTKSYLLSLTSNDEQRKTVTESWKKLSSKFEDNYSRLDNLLSSYRLYIQETRAESSIYEELKDEFDSTLHGETSVVELARDIDRYAEEFLSVENDQSREMYMLSNLKHTQYWKTLLTTAKKQGFEDYEGLVDALVAMYYSYWVGGHTSAKIKNPSYDLLSLIKDGGSLDEVWEYIEDDRSSKNIAQKVQNNLDSDVYEASWHRPLLLAIEYRFTPDMKTSEIEPGQELHREHILPKKFTTAMENEQYWRENFSAEEAAKLRHSLGNLIPLEQEVHETVQQKPFPTKAAHYMGSDSTLASVAEDRAATNFDLTRRVVEEYDDWTPENVRDFKDYLVKKSASLLRLEEGQLLQVEGAAE
ncbi:GmrSD restriction endonuclease domain-containing protein [Natronorubrum tibetense]|uniref:DUF262 domain-containing protein n=1 Tax=Natronorubrum tibetense GA33 TaxID=1114856 RepID=L9VS35_9EURY|nr:DUF262 domain-containing protein [Natronorubrum tibetense]ELY39871.1 hypothetical protein C496_14376 [Natronorubrum tibetense GA33]